MTDRETIEAHLCVVRMVEQIPGCGLYTPDRRLPDCPVCDEDELWVSPGGPSLKNVVRCYRCSYRFEYAEPGADPDRHWLTAPIAEVDAELRRLGLDPAEVGAEGERVAREALAKRRATNTTPPKAGGEG